WADLVGCGAEDVADLERRQVRGNGKHERADTAGDGAGERCSGVRNVISCGTDGRIISVRAAAVGCKNSRTGAPAARGHHVNVSSILRITGPRIPMGAGANGYDVGMTGGITWTCTGKGDAGFVYTRLG